MTPRPPSTDDADGEVLPEGEEAPPRGVRVMALLRWALIAGLAVLAVYTVGRHFKWWGARSPAHASYRCPMHPSVRAGSPIACSICGMDLVTSRAPGGSEKATSDAERKTHRCPLHPDYGGATPGSCPVCGEPFQRSHHDSPPGLGVVVPAKADAPHSARVSRKRVSSTLAFPGVIAIDERRLWRVQPRYSGWIERVGPFETGARVEKGALLATLYSGEVLAAQEEMLRALNTADRWLGPEVRKVREDLLRSAGDRLSQLGVAAVDIARVRRTRKPERSVVVRAPAAGRVLFRGAARGAFAQPGTELFTLGDLSRVWFIAEVPERDAGSVKVGQRAALRLDAFPGRTFEAPIAAIYPLADPGARTLKVRVELDNDDEALRPGLQGQLTLHAEPREVLLVPTESLIDSGDRVHTFVKRGGGRFEPRTVVVGGTYGDETEVKAGLDDGDEVARSALFLLDAESQLQAAGAAAGAPHAAERDAGAGGASGAR